MAESIRVSDLIPASAEAIFLAWLDADRHSAFTGGRATIDVNDGSFTAWDGYIQGRTLATEPHRRIVQSWRTSEFPAEAPPSRLEVWLEQADGGTLVTLVHTDIPEGQGSSYESGWKEHYLEPLKKYFSGSLAIPHAQSPEAVKTKAVAKKKPAPRKAKKKVARKAKAKVAAKSKSKKPARRAPAKKRKASRRARRR